MDSAKRLEYPRLADHVCARRHWADGAEQVVLFDTQRDVVLALPEQTWRVLSCADGTRSVQGIVAAALRLGVKTGETQVRGLFDELQRCGLLSDGAPADLLVGSVSRPQDDMRAIEEMPGAAYQCDGTGGCCRTYQTITFLPADVHRACATLPTRHEATSNVERVFLPIHGSAPTALRAVMMIDGACAYLDGDGGCSLHRAGGAQAKPTGCQWYPVHVVDDGDSVRAVPHIECLCVARPRPDGAPLLPAEVRRVCDLPIGIMTTVVPETICVGDGGELRRDVACRLIDEAQAQILDDDPVVTLWRWATRLRMDPTATPRRGTADDGAMLEELAHHFLRIAARLDRRRSRERAFRGRADGILVRLDAFAMAARMLGSHTMIRALLRGAIEQPELERHVLRAAIFGRRWLQGEDLVAALETEALWLALGRAVTAFTPPEADSTLREAPLAAAQALARAG